MTRVSLTPAPSDAGWPRSICTTWRGLFAGMTSEFMVGDRWSLKGGNQALCLLPNPRATSTSIRLARYEPGYPIGNHHAKNHPAAAVVIGRLLDPGHSSAASDGPVGRLATEPVAE